jgi:phosphinothricin acetyltransferase
VAEAADMAPIAWASLNAFNPRRAYDQVADLSVYVERVALYERCGFREIGIYSEQGMLDGRWVDTVVMERLL